MKPLIIGTRGSKLALSQTHQIMDKIKNVYPDQNIEICIIRTGGDKFPASPLDQMGMGVFVKEIETASAGIGRGRDRRTTPGQIKRTGEMKQAVPKELGLHPAAVHAPVMLIARIGGESLPVRSKIGGAALPGF